MSLEKGSLSIHSENIFPIIKKWLYSDHDIFIRELISNACDAITKVKQLSSLGEADLGEDKDFAVKVIYHPENKTLTFSDNGIGMTEEEIKKYINQIAFSGAEDFIATYKDKADQDQIIGHFGLGFYSSFMVSERVSIHTKSYRPEAPAVKWFCDGGTEFEMEEGDRANRGTDIVLYLGEDGKDFESEHVIRSTIEKYCSFMPYPIYFEVVRPEAEKAEENLAELEEFEASKTETEGEAAEETKVAEPKKPTPLNDVSPLYTHAPNDCTDDQYKEFYRKTFMDFKEPLFWIHLNMDYPFNLKGILYFPKLNTEFDNLEGRIKLYNNQVFVADNVKEVIPEFLLLLKGVIDCPDLPLNVSRSFLQNDGFAKKISDYIAKKVADKLSGMFKTQRPAYEGFWDDLHMFIKFGALKDTKFKEKMIDHVLLKTVNGEYLSLTEYKEKHSATASDKVYYTTDRVQQAQYIQMLAEHMVDTVILDHSIDGPFISMMEAEKENTAFTRVDGDLTDLLKATSEETEEVKKADEEKLTKSFKDALHMEQLKVQVENLKNEDVAGMIILSENNRRMQEMMKMYGMAGLDPNMFPSEETLVLNKKHPLIQFILRAEDSSSELYQMVVAQVYDLAVMSHKTMTPEAMSAFIKRSNDLMKRMIAH